MSFVLTDAVQQVIDEIGNTTALGTETGELSVNLRSQSESWDKAWFFLTYAKEEPHNPVNQQALIIDPPALNAIFTPVLEITYNESVPPVVPLSTKFLTGASIGWG